ncbi:hypothetical protein LCGC14_0930980 [marine sediment metagenome]|uniref:Bacteriophage tail tape measure N-terminal domain-containing protein n=1 Tax=marine sediment metagenome TaxID=412755 RepID=A0A0F9NSJ7_9ZZZZ
MALMEAHVIIKASLAPLRRGLAMAKSAVVKAVAVMQKAFNKLVSVGKKAFLGLAAAMGVAIWAASKQEDVIARLETTLKATGHAAGLTKNQLLKMASEIQKVTRFGDETITSMQTMLLTFKQIKGDEFKRATIAALDMAAAEAAVSGRTVDLLATSIRLGKALNDPILGVTALRRVGVQLTEQQEKMIKSFVDVGNIAGAQVLILGELESQFGGMASVIDTTRGAFAQMKDVLGDVAETIGKPFLDNMKRTALAIKDWALTHEEQIGRIAKSFDKLIEVSNYVIAQFMKPLMDWMKKLAAKFAGFVTEAKLEEGIWKVGEWADKIWSRVKALWTLIKDLWSGGLIADAMKFGLDKAYEQVVAWGRRISIVISAIAKRVGYEFSQYFGERIGKGLIDIADKISGVSTLILVPLQKALYMAGAAALRPSVEGKPPTMRGVLERAAAVTARKVEMPPELRKVLDKFSLIIDKDDALIEEKWRQLRAEFSTAERMSKTADDMAKTAAPVAPTREAGKFGVVGLREAWSQMVSGMQADPMVTHQKETTNAVKSMAKDIANAVMKASADEISVLKTVGTVGA